MVTSRSIWHCRCVSICRPMLFKYDGNILRISWNCPSPEAKFKSSDSWAAADTATRQTKIQAMRADSILTFPSDHSETNPGPLYEIASNRASREQSPYLAET